MKTIKNFTYLDLKDLLNSIPDEELAGHLIQVAYLGVDAYGSAKEEWDDEKCHDVVVLPSKK